MWYKRADIEKTGRISLNMKKKKRKKKKREIQYYPKKKLFFLFKLLFVSKPLCSLTLCAVSDDDLLERERERER